jgi:hypothetical protein
MSTQKKFKTRDIFLSSTIFAITQKPPAIEVDRKLSIFVHELSASVNTVIAAYNANGSVPVQDFIAAYKELRSKMYASRG